MNAPLEVGGYELDRILAKGGMAEVWLAHKRGLGGFSKQVVVKRVLPQLAEDKSFMELFLKEARVAALFTHVNLVQIFELGESAGSYFIAMEYVRGCTLRALQRACFDKGAGLPLSVLCRILSDASAGLSYAHDLKNLKGRALDLVHLDVSPENLLISFEGITKVSDFGVARAREGTHSAQLKDVMGKAGYMAPEHAAGKPVDRRADVYALGAIAFEFVSGRQAIEPDPSQTQERQLREATIDYADVLEVCPGLKPVLERALALEPKDRQATALIFSQELVEALGPPASDAEVGATLTELLAKAASPIHASTTRMYPGGEVLAGRSTQRLPEDGLETRDDLPPVAIAARSGTPASLDFARDDRAPDSPPAPVPPAASHAWRYFAVIAGALAALLGIAKLRAPDPIELVFLGPEGSALVVDGKPVELNQPQQLEPGTHRLETIDLVTNQSFGRWLDVTPGMSRNVVVKPP